MGGEYVTNIDELEEAFGAEIDKCARTVETLVKMIHDHWKEKIHLLERQDTYVLHVDPDSGVETMCYRLHSVPMMIGNLSFVPVEICKTGARFYPRQEDVRTLSGMEAIARMAK